MDEAPWLQLTASGLPSSSVYSSTWPAHRSCHPVALTLLVYSGAQAPLLKELAAKASRWGEKPGSK